MATFWAMISWQIMMGNVNLHLAVHNLIGLYSPRHKYGCSNLENHLMSHPHLYHLAAIMF